MAENVKITISALDKTKKGFGSATKGLKAVAGAVLNAKTAIVGLVGAAGFGLLISRSLQATDTLAKTANKIGTTTEALGALRYAADLTGVSTQTRIWPCKGLLVELPKQRRVLVRLKAQSRNWV